MNLPIMSPGLSLTVSDYDSNDALDRYSQADIDDRSSLPEMTRAERLAAEQEMLRRDRQDNKGRRAGRRDRMPAFMQSDDEEVEGFGDGLLAGVNVRRRRRQYDERVAEDDVEDDEVRFELGVLLMS